MLHYVGLNFCPDWLVIMERSLDEQSPFNIAWGFGGVVCTS